MNKPDLILRVLKMKLSLSVWAILQPKWKNKGSFESHLKKYDRTETKVAGREISQRTGRAVTAKSGSYNLGVLTGKAGVCGSFSGLWLCETQNHVSGNSGRTRENRKKKIE